MTALDSAFSAASDVFFDLDGEACTIRRPHTLQLFDGVAITSLLVKTQAEINDTTLVLEAASSARLQGGLPVGIVLVLAGTSYTVQAAVKVVKSSKQITVAILPVIDAQALVGASVTVPGDVSFVGTATAAPRYFTETLSSSAAALIGAPVGTTVFVIERGDLTIELEPSPNGDYIDVSGASQGMVSRVVDSSPEDWEVILS